MTRRTLATCCATHTLHDGLSDVSYVLLPLLAQTFGLSLAQVGLIRSAHRTAMAAFQIPAGLLAERFGERNLLALGTLAAGCAFVALGYVAGFWAILAVLFLAGAGSAVQHPLCSTIISRAFPAEGRRAALGTYNFAGDVGKFAFGGAVSLRATLVGGASYASLMLVDVVAIPPSGSPFFQFVKRHPTTLDELPPYIHEAILRAYVSAASHRGLREHELAELVAPWRTEAGQPAFYRQIAQYDEKFLAENERGLGDLSIPVKVLWGRDDAWIPPATGRRLAKLIPGASYAEVPDAGHLMQYDAPVALATALRDWLYF